jgi:predicted nucleic acid-binding Zn finger protein
MRTHATIPVSHSNILARVYCGNAPDATLDGDACAIIHGIRTPFMIRSVRVKGKDNCYQVVGAAYVVSKQVDAEGTQMRLGDDGCEDWREWYLPTENIVLCMRVGK